MNYKDEIINFIIKDNQLEVKTIDIDSDLMDTGILDSLGFLTIMGFVNEKWNIFIDMSEMETSQMNTIRKVADLIKKRVEMK